MSRKLVLGDKLKITLSLENKVVIRLERYFRQSLCIYCWNILEGFPGKKKHAQSIQRHTQNIITIELLVFMKP